MAVRQYSRSSHLEVFLGKGVLKIWSKFTGEHPCSSVSLIHCTSPYGCSPVMYKICCMPVFRTHFSKNTSGWLLLIYRLFSTFSSCIWKGVNLHVVETKWGKRFSQKFSWHAWKEGRGRNKMAYYILS